MLVNYLQNGNKKSAWNQAKDYNTFLYCFILGTPAGLPAANQDLSSETFHEDDDKSSLSSPVIQSISARSSKSSLTSVDSTISSKSYPGRVVKRKNSDRRYIGKPRSPSERKIGIVRRRSQVSLKFPAKIVFKRVFTIF